MDLRIFHKIEAIEMNIPIIYSDKKYVKEQFENATYPLDLDNVNSLVDILLKFEESLKKDEKLKHYPKIRQIIVMKIIKF